MVPLMLDQSPTQHAPAPSGDGDIGNGETLKRLQSTAERSGSWAGSHLFVSLACT